MSNQIDVGMSADAKGFVRDINEAIRALDEFKAAAEGTQAAVSNIDFSGKGGGGSGGGGSPMESMVADSAQLALQIQTSLRAAFAPINDFASMFAGQFNLVGGTIVELARRIDSAMKMPQVDASLEKMQQKIRSTMEAGAEDTEKASTKMQAAIRKIGPVADKAIGAFRKFLSVKDWMGSIGDVAKPLQRISSISFGSASSSIGAMNGGLGKTNAIVQTATTSFRRMGAEIALALGAFGMVYKAVGFIKSGVTEASNLNETVSKTDAILGEASPAVKAYADTMASQFGMVKRETLDAASAFGGLGKGLAGLSGDTLSQFSIQFTQLAADLSSFANMDMSTATKALQTGLAGNQSDVLKNLGVVLLDDTVKAYAYAHGMAKAGEELDESQKVTARAGLIMEQLADAQGDLARTADSPANAMRRATGSLTNISAEIGQTLLPILQKGLGLVGEFGGFLTGMFQSSKGSMEGFVEGVVGGIDTVASYFRNFSETWEIVKLTFRQGVNYVIETLAVLPENFGLVLEWMLKNAPLVFHDVFFGAANLIKNLGENVWRLGEAIRDALSGKGFHFEFKDLLEGFEPMMEKLPEMVQPHLVSLQGEIDKHVANIAEQEAARKAAIKPAVAGPKVAIEKLAAPTDAEIKAQRSSPRRRRKSSKIRGSRWKRIRSSSPSSTRCSREA
ncbi:hypothetical protein [Singulisphaera sp. PoT]|uniref:hypothetical protein n=1 Tax=Singulisphaera sp. PoT TaxID=3411797 RepID=UPI003BF5498D